MLIKFAFQDFLQDRKFKNTTCSDIHNYKVLLGGFIEYCNRNNISNVENITSNNIKRFSNGVSGEGEQCWYSKF